MRLTRKKAIELCIELWTWLAETGRIKSEWPKWTDNDINAQDSNYCWFCYMDNYTMAGTERLDGGFCAHCPYHKKYGHCRQNETFYKKWDLAKTPRTRKKYAKLFLEQIKSIPVRKGA